MTSVVSVVWLFYVNLTFWSLPVTLFTTSFNIKKSHIVITWNSRILYGSRNKQHILPYRTLRDCLLQPRWKVFTAQLAQSPYITQIPVFFKSLVRNYLGSHDIVVSIVTRLRVWGYRVCIPAGTRAFSFLQNVHTGPGSHLGSLRSSDRSVAWGGVVVKALRY